MPRRADLLTETPPDAEVQPVRRKRRASGGIECFVGLGIGLAGLFASRLGQLWIGFDVFSHFTLQFALIALAFLLGGLMPRARLLTATVLLVLGIAGVGMWPHLASRGPWPAVAAAGGERALKVASFNTLWVSEDADAVKAEILRLDADVLVLIEMGSAKRRILSQIRDRYPHQADCYDLDYCNFVVLSRLPITRTDARGIWRGPPYIRVKLGPEAGGLTVFGVHTTRFPYAERQLRHVTEIAKLIEATAGRKLVMGDFNATPFSRIMTVLENRAGLSRLTFLPTWPAQLGLPQIAIDHILVSPGLRLLAPARSGESAGSDHYPVVALIGVPLTP